MWHHQGQILILNWFIGLRIMTIKLSDWRSGKPFNINCKRLGQVGHWTGLDSGLLLDKCRLIWTLFLTVELHCLLNVKRFSTPVPTTIPRVQRGLGVNPRGPAASSQTIKMLELVESAERGKMCKHYPAASLVGKSRQTPGCDFNVFVFIDWFNSTPFIFICFYCIPTDRLDSIIYLLIWWHVSQ